MIEQNYTPQEIKNLSFTSSENNLYKEEYENSSMVQ